MTIVVHDPTCGGAALFLIFFLEMIDNNVDIDIIDVNNLQLDVADFDDDELPLNFSFSSLSLLDRPTDLFLGSRQETQGQRWQ